MIEFIQFADVGQEEGHQHASQIAVAEDWAVHREMRSDAILDFLLRGSAF